jgi:hypothetical protein
MPRNKSIYDKPIAHIINEEKLKVFSLKSERRQGCQLSPLLLNSELEYIGRENKTQIRNKRNTNGKRRQAICI